MRPYAGPHVLLSTPHPQDKIETLAARQGWRTELVDARLFKVLKIWIDDATLIELLTPSMIQAYVETFGSAGITSLDGKLRALEQPV